MNKFRTSRSGWVSLQTLEVARKQSQTLVRLPAFVRPTTSVVQCFGIYLEMPRKPWHRMTSTHFIMRLQQIIPWLYSCQKFRGLAWTANGGATLYVEARGLGDRVVRVSGLSFGNPTWQWEPLHLDLHLANPQMLHFPLDFLECFFSWIWLPASLFTFQGVFWTSCCFVAFLLLCFLNFGFLPLSASLLLLLFWFFIGFQLLCRSALPLGSLWIVSTPISIPFRPQYTQFVHDMLRGGGWFDDFSKPRHPHY